MSSLVVFHVDTNLCCHVNATVRGRAGAAPYDTQQRRKHFTHSNKKRDDNVEKSKCIVGLWNSGSP